MMHVDFKYDDKMHISYLSVFLTTYSIAKKVKLLLIQTEKNIYNFIIVNGFSLSIIAFCCIMHVRQAGKTVF